MAFVDGGTFMDVATSAIAYVDDRWGRPYASALAFAVTVLPIGIVVTFWLW